MTTSTATATANQTARLDHVISRMACENNQHGRATPVNTGRLKAADALADVAQNIANAARGAADKLEPMPRTLADVTSIKNLLHATIQRQLIARGLNGHDSQTLAAIAATCRRALAAEKALPAELETYLARYAHTSNGGRADHRLATAALRSPRLAALAGDVATRVALNIAEVAKTQGMAPDKITTGYAVTMLAAWGVTGVSATATAGTLAKMARGMARQGARNDSTGSYAGAYGGNIVAAIVRRARK